MLVGHKDAGQVLKAETMPSQRGTDAPHGDPRVDQQLGAAALDQGAIA